MQDVEMIALLPNVINNLTGLKLLQSERFLESSGLLRIKIEPLDLRDSGLQRRGHTITDVLILEDDFVEIDLRH